MKDQIYIWKHGYCNTLWAEEEGADIWYSNAHVSGKILIATPDGLVVSLPIPKNQEEIPAWKIPSIALRQLIERPDGTKEYRVNTLIHREDGPAIEYPDGKKKYFLHGKELTFSDWVAACEGK
jgi:hypothetical protein